jgi:hypothetical protein
MIKSEAILIMKKWYNQGFVQYEIVMNFLKDNENDLFVYLSHASERIFICKEFEFNIYM